MNLSMFGWSLLLLCGISSAKKREGTGYTVLSSQDIYEDMHWMANEYPQFVSLERAQDVFGLPTAGGEDDCVFEEGVVGCSNYVLTITSDKENKELPEVLLSGCLHGNERVGPTAVIETAKMLVTAASCEEEACRDALMDDWMVSEEEQTWFRYLVQTRRIVVVPTANALGYDRDEREENGVDPNRDFPFEIVNPTMCMQTVAARTLNELWLNHLFINSLTFHGGMEVVAYEWGSPSYGTKLSPDHIAQEQIASGYSQYGGGWRQSSAYRTGTLNRVVYPVVGGMEDWAYAASWDTEHTSPCTPTTFGGYNVSKTTYSNATHRTFNMLVEASNQKTPPHKQLGVLQHYLEKPDQKLNGHISRNIRLSLLAIDLVRPYTYWYSVGHDDSTQIITTTLEPVVLVPPTQTSQVNLSWTVGGAFTVDETRLIYTTDPDFIPTTTHTDQVERTDIQTGATRWSQTQQNNVFTATLDLSNILKNQGDTIFVWAACKVDSEWSFTPSQGYSPQIQPQSHMVNARTNPDYFVRNPINNKTIQGKLDYFSYYPLLIQLDSSIHSILELNSHTFNHVDKTKPQQYSSGTNHKRPLTIVAMIVVVAGLVFVSFQIKKVVSQITNDDDSDFQIVSAADDPDDEDAFVTTSSYKDEERQTELPSFH